MTQMERFLFDCPKVILVLHQLRYAIGLKSSCYVLIQSEVKPKPIVIHSHSFSRALRQLHVITSSFDLFIGLSVSFVIGQSDCFGFSFYDTQLKTALSKILKLIINEYSMPLI